jgi:hypothetical protein
MNKKAYNKPEMRERKRVIVTTMICQSRGLEMQKRNHKKDGTKIDGGQQTLFNPWDAD